MAGRPTLEFSGLAKECERLRAELVRVEGERDAISTALRDVLGFIESGVLVRDTTLDDEPDWATRQIPMLRALAKAKELLDPLVPSRPTEPPAMTCQRCGAPRTRVCRTCGRNYCDYCFGLHRAG